MKIGSIWKKWDLHIHTPQSFHHEYKFENDKESKNYKRNLWDKFIDELEKIDDIPAIGITDYFSIEGYRKIIEYRKKVV